MLKRMCAEMPKDCDRYLASLLSACREVPKASLGFSTFGLLYGRHPRGPLASLRKLWTNAFVRLTARLNKTIADMILMYDDVQHKLWDEVLSKMLKLDHLVCALTFCVLPYVAFAYNTAVYETTEVTPF